jgi:hypothetical protein
MVVAFRNHNPKTNLIEQLFMDIPVIGAGKGHAAAQRWTKSVDLLSDQTAMAIEV